MTTALEQLRAANEKLGRELNAQAMAHAKRWKRLTENYQGERDANQALRLAMRNALSFLSGGHAAARVLVGALPPSSASAEDRSGPPIVEELDPGVRRLVAYLNEAGFETTDSGDGVSKSPASIDNPDGDPDAETIPHVYMVVDSSKLVEESHRLLATLEGDGIEAPEMTIESSYSPFDRVGVLALHGVDDRAFDRAKAAPASAEARTSEAQPEHVCEHAEAHEDFHDCRPAPLSGEAPLTRFQAAYMTPEQRRERGSHAAIGAGGGDEDEVKQCRAVSPPAPGGARTCILTYHATGDHTDGAWTWTQEESCETNVGSGSKSSPSSSSASGSTQSHSAFSAGDGRPRVETASGPNASEARACKCGAPMRVGTSSGRYAVDPTRWTLWCCDSCHWHDFVDVAPVAPSSGSAVDVINEKLGIGAAVTHKGDELKCYTPDRHEGLGKTYFGAEDCHVLAGAFAALAAQFTRAAQGDAPKEEP